MNRWIACWWLSLLAACLSFFGCVFHPDVVRVVDGEQDVGKYVEPDAYSLFMQGLVAELSGDLAVAERLYLAAYRRDRRAVAILSRLGAVRCAWGPDGYDPAQETFNEAMEIDPSFAPIYLELARCAIRRSKPEQAVLSARRALELDPFRLDVSLTLAEAMKATGNATGAALVLDGFALLRDSSRLEQAQLELNDPQSRRSHATRDPQTFQRLDQLLVLGELDAARDVASKMSLDAATVAVRACGLGLWKMARKQAKLVLAAEPGHPDATMAFLSASGPHLQALDPGIRRRLLRNAMSKRSASPLAKLVFADALMRRFGRELAVAWLDGAGFASADDDWLIRTLRRRLYRKDSWDGARLPTTSE